MHRLIFFVLVLFTYGCAGSKAVEQAAPVEGYLARAEVQAFISEMVSEGIDQSVLEEAFADAEYKQKIIDAISRPAERTLTWDSYQDIFLNRRRVTLGQEFVAEHQAAFAAAEEKYGVPTHVIAAIIGVETLYGRIKGSYRVIDSLSTLAFDYPPRSKFFRSELKQFFILAKEEQQSALDPIGSYAGAMGYGQFISSSYRNYAVDFDGDGVRDIWNNPVDAIGSVANYLSRHGWQRGAATVAKANLTKGDVPDFLNEGLKPSRTFLEVTTAGLATKEIQMNSEDLVSPMLLKGKKGDEYWIGFNNFYVITRYNHSKLYAMAVFQLSEQIEAELQAAQKG